MVGYPAPNTRTVAVDTEWGSDGRILTVGLATATTRTAVEEDFDLVVRSLADSQFCVGHSAAGDVNNLVALGLPTKESWLRGEGTRDSLLLARMSDENGLKGAYELENILLAFHPVPPWKHKTRSFVSAFETAPADLRVERCGLDAWASFQVAEHYGKMLAKKRPLVEFTHRIASTLSRLTLAGAFVDRARFEDMGQLLETDLLHRRDLLAKAAAAAGMSEFVPTNDGHIRGLLFGKLGLPVLGRTPKDKLPSVDKVTLTNLDHDVARVLIDYNKAEKLYSVNVKGLRDLLHSAGSIDGVPVSLLSFNINPLGARTGRRSSSDPNSQNWPNSVRRIIRSRWKDGRIGDFDYSKLEVVLIAWAAGSARLLRDFTRGNGYIDVARGMWGTAVVEGTPEYKATKSIVLGVHYNMQTPKMSRGLWNLGIRFSPDLDTHMDETDRLRRKYLSLYPELVDFMEARAAELLDTQRVVSATGRVRHLPCPDGESTAKYWHLANQAINFPIQSLASDVTGAAVVAIEEQLLALHGMSYRQYTEMLLGARKKARGGVLDYPMSLIINEVHDDVVLDMHPDFRKRDTELVVETMRAVPLLRALVPGFDIPLKVGVQIASHWGEKEA